MYCTKSLLNPLYEVIKVTPHIINDTKQWQLFSVSALSEVVRSAVRQKQTDDGS